MNKNFKVDFIGVGFSRSGTTWVARMLKEHPEICFSSIKETHFFDEEYNYEKGIDFYKSFFKCSGKKITGEFTPEYYVHPQVAKRIKTLFPDVKLLFVMRNPMERAFSHYLYRKRKTGKPKNMNEIFDESKNPIQAQIIPPGFYYRHIQQFLGVFDRDQMLFLIH